MQSRGGTIGDSLNTSQISNPINYDNSTDRMSVSQGTAGDGFNLTQSIEESIREHPSMNQTANNFTSRADNNRFVNEMLVNMSSRQH